MHQFSFEPVSFPPVAEALRGEVRAFLAEEVANGTFTPRKNSWSSFDAGFSKKCGERGYIGMVWPKKYGGHERTALERYVMTEEMLAGGAPVGGHWVADRQSGNQILKNGSERARATDGVTVAMVCTNSTSSLERKSPSTVLPRPRTATVCSRIRQGTK